jgi:hypothetical protein
MNLSFHRPATVLLGILAVGVAGCGGASTAVPTKSSGETAEHAHEHADHGPHDGDLVELGNDEYHAEIVHEADGKVSVYILDSSAKSAVPIDAAEVTLNIVHDGTPEQISLAAAPMDTDPAGQSSRFVTADAHASEDLDHEGVAAKLAVTINGTSYQGAIEHDHDHAGHDHGDHQH